ncbi:hypothetical protein NM688_g7703 [Phlebia brevispora]|uniref:Uncharacterized protein n=1 Tax=Phlebia brevispora TaxID=194682 RepID=A0ACC1S212_9APHY|nr:hypothetical protein NM688_g7703 [Phlebia brevispora]
MKRIREFGAGCLVCCLDDDELQLLGAPWEEYSQIAHGLGLDILRIPMPEGLAPADIAAFDNHLLHIINTYTLRGIPVLVHCRGGIGRAGLVACSWIIRLGLCGCVDTQCDAQPASMLACKVLEDLPSIPPTAIVKRDTLELLERIITLVRRRRSLKAVETFEQVKFLVEYVEFLRNRVVRDTLRTVPL